MADQENMNEAPTPSSFMDIEEKIIIPTEDQDRKEKTLSIDLSPMDVSLEEMPVQNKADEPMPPTEQTLVLAEFLKVDFKENQDDYELEEDSNPLLQAFVREMVPKTLQIVRGKRSAASSIDLEQPAPKIRQHKVDAVLSSAVNSINSMKMLEEEILNIHVGVEFKIDTSLETLDKKSSHNLKEELKIFVREKSTDRIAIYVDATVLGDSSTGIGVYVPSTEMIRETKKKFKVTTKTISSSAETFAILIALRYAVDNGLNFPVIFTDCLSVCKTLISYAKQEKIPESVAEIFKLLQKTNATIVWIRAHKGIKGNEEADELAKKAAEDGELIDFKIPEQDLVNMFRNEVRKYTQ